MIVNENIKKLGQNYKDNCLAHVYLIETNDYDRALKDIIELVKIINCPNDYLDECSKCNLCHLITNDIFPGLKIVYPDGQNIKKQQMEDLKLSLATVPYLSNYNTYIINNAEKFNASSANTMLKFIEEPNKQVIGFLITNNRENVIETIKSRCEIVKANYQKSDSFNDEKIKNLAITYLEKIEVEKILSIVYNNIVLEENLERDEVVKLFQFIMQFYKQALDRKLDIEVLSILNTFKEDLLIKRMTIVSDVLNRLKYNVNISLLLDDFVLRLEC